MNLEGLAAQLRRTAEDVSALHERHPRARLVRNQVGNLSVMADVYGEERYIGYVDWYEGLQIIDDHVADVEVVETRSAGWMFRCHRCDITDTRLTEQEARSRLDTHEHASGLDETVGEP